jgi:hypothetical protein
VRVTRAGARCTRYRLAATTVVLLALPVILAACKQTAGLSRQEVVVVFKPTATAADHSRVWELCRNVEGVAAEPLVTTSKYPSVLRSNVRFRVDHATNLQLQRLYACLGKDPTVVGYTPTGDGQ